MRHHFWGVALLAILLVSCGSNGSNSPKSEEQKPSIQPTPEAPALKKAELGPQPDLGSVIILEVPPEGAQSFYVEGKAGARYLAKVTPLYSSSKTKKKNVSAVVAPPEQAQAGKPQDAEASPEPPKPPQGFTATFFPVVGAPSLPGNFYTAETLKGLKEGRYQLPSPPPEAEQATDTSPVAALPADQSTPKDVPEKSTPLPTLPESLWSPVTNKGTEAFEVETEVLPIDQATQPVVLEVKNLDAVPRTVKVVIREKKP